MREQVAQRFEERLGAGDGDLRQSELREVIRESLDELIECLRQEWIHPPSLSFSARPSTPDSSALRDYRLLGDCIYDLLEDGGVEVSLREMRILWGWLTARASASMSAGAQDAAELNRTLAALLDAVPDPVAAIHADGRHGYLNRAARALKQAAGGLPCGATLPHLPAAIAGSTVTTEVVFPTPKGARWFEHTLSPVHREDGIVGFVAAVTRDIHDRKRSETSLSLSAKIAALAGILDYEEVLAAVARLSIPELADWCIVDVVDERGARRVEVAHRDPTKAPIVEAIRRFPLDHPARRRMPANRALRTGRPVLVPDLTEGLLRQMTDDADFFQVTRQFGPCSEIVVPVTLPGSVATMLFFLTTESGRRYGPEDVAIAEELVKRAAQLVENARVHQQLRQTEERFRVALAHSAITLFEQDAEGRYRWMYNPPPAISIDDVLGKTNDEILPEPEEAALLNALDRAVLRSGVPIQEEVRLTLPKGDPLHFLISQEPVRDASGAIAGLIGGVEPGAGDHAGADGRSVRALRPRFLIPRQLSRKRARPRALHRAPDRECARWSDHGRVDRGGGNDVYGHGPARDRCADGDARRAVGAGCAGAGG